MNKQIQSYQQQQQSQQLNNYSNLLTSIYLITNHYLPNKMSTPRFNLRNASLYLSKLKTKYIQNKSQQNRDNTFIDQQEQISQQSNPSMRKNQCSQKLDSVTDRLFQNNQQQQQYDNDNDEIRKKLQQRKSQNIRQTYQQTIVSQIQNKKQIQQQHQTEFCDLIIIKYLEQTLTIYKADLETLQHNRENLEQQIYFLGKKIGKLHELKDQNNNMQAQISQLNDQLKSTIAKYHQSNRIVWKQKVQLAKTFNSQRNKIKQLLLLTKKQQYDNRDITENYFKVDSFAGGYVDKYMEFLQFKRQQQRQIAERVNLVKDNQSTQQNAKLVQRVFKGKQDVYFRDHTIKNITKEQQQQNIQTILPVANVPAPTIMEKKKEKKVILYDEPEHQTIQQVPKQKPKKLTEAERASLLGDLKNFSKSFKLPK